MRSQRGASLVMTALVLAVLMGIVAISVDIGVLMVHKRSLQAAADLAAMAGVQHLPEDPAGAQSAAASVLTQNGVSAGEVGSITVESGGTELVVNAGRNVSLFFARVLGFQQSGVGVQARARVDAKPLYPDLVPWGLPEATYVVGKQYALKQGKPGDLPTPGNFQAVELKSPMDVLLDYEPWVGYGYHGAPIKIGDIRPSHTGNLGNHTQAGINARQSRAAGFNCAYGKGLDPLCPMIVTALIVRGYDNGKSPNLQVISFARFLVTGTAQGGKEIDAIYLGPLDSNVFDPAALTKHFFLVG